MVPASKVKIGGILLVASLEETSFKKLHMTTFLREYLKKIRSSLGNDFDDNYDEVRFGPKPAEIKKTYLKRVIKDLRRYLGLELDCASKGLPELSWLYEKLVDEESRRTLVDIVAYRGLGNRKIKLANSCAKYWEKLRIAESLVDKSVEPLTRFKHFEIRMMDLKPIGYPIKIFDSPYGALIAYIEEQYRCATNDFTVECGEGDFVIDAGGCWGDTALYFAAKTGKRGKVYSFEFLPFNLDIFRRNLDLNADLKQRVELIEAPLWSEAGQDIPIIASGPGTRLVASGKSARDGKISFRTEAIDHLVETGKITKVDFIKMDIEGAELRALKGAEQAIRRFKPKLAITVYHSLQDFWEIPKYIDSLELGYQFSLRHFTIHAEETVLFAMTSNSENSS